MATSYAVHSSESPAIAATLKLTRARDRAPVLLRSRRLRRSRSPTARAAREGRARRRRRRIASASSRRPSRPARDPARRASRARVPRARSAQTTAARAMPARARPSLARGTARESSCAAVGGAGAGACAGACTRSPTRAPPRCARACAGTPRAACATGARARARARAPPPGARARDRPPDGVDDRARVLSYDAFRAAHGVGAAARPARRTRDAPAPAADSAARASGARVARAAPPCVGGQPPEVARAALHIIGLPGTLARLAVSRGQDRGERSRERAGEMIAAAARLRPSRRGVRRRRRRARARARLARWGARERTFGLCVLPEPAARGCDGARATDARARAWGFAAFESRGPALAAASPSSMRLRAPAEGIERLLRRPSPPAPTRRRCRVRACAGVAGSARARGLRAGVPLACAPDARGRAARACSRAYRRARAAGAALMRRSSRSATTTGPAARRGARGARRRRGDRAGARARRREGAARRPAARCALGRAVARLRARRRRRRVRRECRASRPRPAARAPRRRNERDCAAADARAPLLVDARAARAWLVALRAVRGPLLPSRARPLHPQFPRGSARARRA